LLVQGGRAGLDCLRARSRSERGSDGCLARRSATATHHRAGPAGHPGPGAAAEDARTRIKRRVGPCRAASGRLRTAAHPPTSSVRGTFPPTRDVHRPRAHKRTRPGSRARASGPRGSAGAGTHHDSAPTRPCGQSSPSLVRGRCASDEPVPRNPPRTRPPRAIADRAARCGTGCSSLPQRQAAAPTSRSLPRCATCRRGRATGRARASDASIPAPASIHGRVRTRRSARSSIGHKRRKGSGSLFPDRRTADPSSRSTGAGRHHRRGLRRQTFPGLALYDVERVHSFGHERWVPHRPGQRVRRVSGLARRPRGRESTPASNGR
jgi:hypothetical protein